VAGARVVLATRGLTVVRFGDGVAFAGVLLAAFVAGADVAGRVDTATFTGELEATDGATATLPVVLLSPPFTAPIAMSTTKNEPPKKAAVFPQPPLRLAGCGCVQPCPHC
jgi:hypothetical protein